jgi:tetrahydromethanopterin S-methyltransferase subunit F
MVACLSAREEKSSQDSQVSDVRYRSDFMPGKKK